MNRNSIAHAAKKMFKFQPIETIYSGYRFRSRLEARYAVFFDTLHIPYEYEKEGFDLNGTPYLPDFWLPEQECWVEIKGERATDEERNKTRALATATQKNVATFCGNIDYQPEISFLDEPPQIWAFNETERELVHASPEILAILQILHKSNIRCEVHDFCGLTMEASQKDYSDEHIEGLISQLDEQRQVLLEIKDSFEEYKEEIEALLTPQDGKQTRFIAQNGLASPAHWCQCPSCRYIFISTAAENRHICTDGTLQFYEYGNSLFRKAAEAARQARFGKEGRG